MITFISAIRTTIITGAVHQAVKMRQKNEEKSIFVALRRSLRRGLPRGLPLKYLSIRLHKSWYQVETSRGPQHKVLRALRCSRYRSVPTSSELLIRVPANSRLDLLFRRLRPWSRTTKTASTLTCNSKLIYDFGSISSSKVCGFTFSSAFS